MKKAQERKLDSNSFLPSLEASFPFSFYASSCCNRSSSNSNTSPSHRQACQCEGTSLHFCFYHTYGSSGYTFPKAFHYVDSYLCVMFWVLVWALHDLHCFAFVANCWLTNLFLLGFLRPFQFLTLLAKLWTLIVYFYLTTFSIWRLWVLRMSLLNLCRFFMKVLMVAAAS